VQLRTLGLLNGAPLFFRLTAVAAYQLLSRGRDAGGAILSGMVFHPHPWLYNNSDNFLFPVVGDSRFTDAIPR